MVYKGMRRRERGMTGAQGVLLQESMIYLPWFNKSGFIKEDMDETVFMFALFKCRKSDKGRN